MDIQKPQNNNNNSRRLMMLMREKTTQKGIKQEDEEQGSDDNMAGEEEEEVLERTDAEEKKQKKLSSARRVGGSGGGITCQAEKCTADLTDAKRYHRRHKVCELHAKAPSALVSGLRQRFCQQCSRFHELSEFDDSKRSCRRRLAGHNERRRKSSSELQGEGGSSSRPKAANPQCRPADHDRNTRAQPSSFPAGSPACKPFQIR